MTNIDQFKEKLLTLKKEHDQRIHSIDKDIRHEGMTSDWSEQATERENDEVLDSLGQTAEDELIQINHALQRIEEGDYFNCEECGEAIPEARLELIPFTSTCAKCAEKLEH